MDWNIIILASILFGATSGVRLHKFFQFLDGFKSEHELRGFLHVGTDYAVFIKVPKPHDKYIIYELYEANNIDDAEDKPQLLAVSKIPIEYIREQLKLFREELYMAKYVDQEVVPGTQVKTLREWQLTKSMKFDSNMLFDDKPNILRMSQIYENNNLK